MMLLMGMWMSLTKNPMNPMMANPMAVAIAIFWNSEKKRKKCMIRIRLNRNLLTFFFFSEFQEIDIATAIGFAIMEFIGFFVKLIQIPINNIIVGS